MKLAFSNIAWDAAEETAARDILRQNGFAGIEVAPTKCWPDWQGAGPDSAGRLRAALRQDGFAVPAMQALLFGMPQLKVFGTAAEQAALVEHIAMVAGLAAALGAGTLVFGSPRNRDRGELDPDAASAQALHVFRAMGEACHAQGVWLGIEANPAQYGCNFLTGWRDAAAFVRLCAHPGVRLHLDAACTYMAGDDVAEAVEQSADILVHVHISEPELGLFAGPVADHARLAAALRQVDYQGWCSLEMRRAEPPLPAIETAARFAREHYG